MSGIIWHWLLKRNGSGICIGNCFGRCVPELPEGCGAASGWSPLIMSIISSSFIASEGLSLCEIILITYLFTILLCLILSEPYPLSVVVIVQSPSCVRLFVTPWTAALQTSLSLTISQSLPKFMSIELVMPPNCLILWCPLLLLPSIFASIRVFSNESAVHIRWLKYWSLGLPASAFPKSIQGWFPLWLIGLILMTKGHSRVFSSTAVWKHQFFGTQPCLWSSSHIRTWLMETPWTWLYGPMSAKWYLCFLTHSLGLS